jgi:hypothetical protein
MTQKNRNRTTSEIKAMMAEDGDFLLPIVRTVIEEFLDAVSWNHSKQLSCQSEMTGDFVYWSRS